MKYSAKVNHSSFAEREGWRKSVKKNTLQEAVTTFKPSGTQGKTECLMDCSWLTLDGGSDGRKNACNAGDLGSSPGFGRSPGEGNGNPLRILAWTISCVQRSLEGYSPRGRKESAKSE